MSVPLISFLECFVYLVYDIDEKSNWARREVLAEKRLDDALEHKKWNNNSGFVKAKILKSQLYNDFI